MAPRITPKTMPNSPTVQRSAGKKLTAGKSSPVPANKKTTLISKQAEKVPLKIKNATPDVISLRSNAVRKNIAPSVATPKPKENKAGPVAAGAPRSAKKPLWKRRPLPAHSGVPVPEKMKQLFKKQLQSLNDSL